MKPTMNRSKDHTNDSVVRRLPPHLEPTIMESGNFEMKYDPYMGRLHLNETSKEQHYPTQVNYLTDLPQSQSLTQY